MKPASGSWYCSLGPPSQRLCITQSNLIYCTIMSLDYNLLYTPTFISGCLQKPRLFFRQLMEMFFICTFAQELQLALLGNVNKYERGSLLSWDLSRIYRGKKIICLLHHKSFSTLAYRRRYQPLWLIPFHDKHMLFHLLWQTWSKPHQFCHWVWTSMTSENQIRKSWFDGLPLITSGQWVRAITEQIFLLPSLISLAPHPKP